MTDKLERPDLEQRAREMLEVALAEQFKKYDGIPVTAGMAIVETRKAAIRAITKALASVPEQDSWQPIPIDIAEAVVRMGEAEWGMIPAKPDADHTSDFADSLRITREHFNLEGDRELHGLYLKGTGTVLCHTGTSPNSAINAQALAGAWNWLLGQSHAALAPAVSAPRIAGGWAGMSESYFKQMVGSIPSEREEIVKWLRGETPTDYTDPQYDIGINLADAIERGEHLTRQALEQGSAE